MNGIDDASGREFEKPYHFAVLIRAIRWSALYSALRRTDWAGSSCRCCSCRYIHISGVICGADNVDDGIPTVGAGVGGNRSIRDTNGCWALATEAIDNNSKAVNGIFMAIIQSTGSG